MTGFDDARMHGAHGHFVDLAAFHAVVVALGRAGTFRARGGRGVAHGLEPGVALGHDAPGLADFTLEALELRAFLAHGRIAFQRQAAGGPQFLPLVMGHDAAQAGGGRIARHQRQFALVVQGPGQAK